MDYSQDLISIYIDSRDRISGTTSDFTISLSQWLPAYVDGICMTEINITHWYYCINENNNTLYIEYDDPINGWTLVNLIIRRGEYINADDLINMINDEFTNQSVNFSFVTFDWNGGATPPTKQNKYLLSGLYAFKLRFDLLPLKSNLNYIMGFDRLWYSWLLPGNDILAPYSFNLSHNDRIYIDLSCVIEPVNSVNWAYGNTSQTLQAISFWGIPYGGALSAYYPLNDKNTIKKCSTAIWTFTVRLTDQLDN